MPCEEFMLKPCEEFMLKQWRRFFRRSIVPSVQYALFTLFVVPAFAGQVSLFPRQPNGTRVTAIRIDSTGNIYITGSVTPANAKAGNLTDAFVAKFSGDGVQLYKTVFAGSADDTSSAIVLGTDGTVYVAGFTLSSDFPITSGALQPALGAANGGQAFLAKIGPNGQVQSATYFGGAQTSGSALALDNTGEVYLTGTSSGNGFPITPGNTGLGNGFFLAKFDPDLSKLLFATLAHGGTVLTLDPQGNIYTAAAATGTIGANVPLQTSPGAFQSSVQARACRGSGIVFLPCSYQFVEKLDPSATKLSYATFVTGSFGATPAGIAVDAIGNVIVAGTTNSADYPITALALQSAYVANAAAPPSQPGRPSINLPPSTGYVTKLNATGTDLIWSTFFGGSVQDAISGMIVDPSGYIYITGQAISNDLPGLSGSVPDGCKPAVNQGLGFVARLSPDGTSLSPSQLIYGAPACTYASCFPNTQSTSSDVWALAVTPDGTAITAGMNGAIARVQLFGSERLACFTDPADNVQITAVAPGQLLSIFGSRITASGGAVPPGGSASSFRGVTVTFDGFAAPILYMSNEQINIQVPYEIVGRDSVEMQVSLGQGSVERKTFPVVQRQPSVFLAPDALLSDIPGYFYCSNDLSRAQHALAINADGTLNSCANGALPGSTVTIFMNGLGPTEPLQTTGSIGAGPPIAIAPGATGTGILSTITFPGAISGVAQVRFQPTSAGFAEVVPTVAGIAVREPVVIWVVAQ
jgi:uncharacterized protein (TIGR03437 family)